jgi:hypothetical protein
VGEPLSEASIALESPGDSEAEADGSEPSLDVESLGDSSSRDGSFEWSPEPPLDLESPGDSEARGDSDGSVGDPGDVACGDEDEPPGLPVLPDPPPDVGDGLVGVGLDDPPFDGVAVGEEDGLVVAERVTGGATPGGALSPAARSCCHDHPTDPPAGTVRPPTP